MKTNFETSLEYLKSLCECDQSVGFTCSACHTSKLIEDQQKVVKNHLFVTDHVSKACLCERFASRFTPKNKRGFDYGEVHPVLGKPEVGSRWKTPRAMIEDCAQTIKLAKELTNA